MIWSTTICWCWEPTLTWGAQASSCEAIPLRQLDHLEVALFGTRLAENLQNDQPGGVAELEQCLEARGVELALPPLTIGLPVAAAFLPEQGFGPAERDAVKAFADDLWEASVSAPMI